MNIHEKFGDYYGELVEITPDTEIIYADCSLGETQSRVEEILDTGAKSIFFDVEDDEMYSSTMFISTDSNTDFKELMLIVAKMRPHEFNEITPYHFRMWFD